VVQSTLVNEALLKDFSGSDVKVYQNLCQMHMVPRRLCRKAVPTDKGFAVAVSLL